MFVRVFLEEPVKDGYVRMLNGIGRAGEQIEAPLYQHYGFASMPVKSDDMDMVMVVHGNNQSVIAEDNGNLRPALTTGQVCLYVDKDNYIMMDADGTLNIKTNNKPVVLDTGTGAIKLGGSTGTQVLMTKAYADAIVAYFAQIVTACAAIPFTLPAFVPPIDGETSTVEAK